MSFARRRPLLGTFITVTCEPDTESDTVDSSVVTAAFIEAERLQKIFSQIDPSSELSRYNREPSLGVFSSELLLLIDRARALAVASENFFNPELERGVLDLAGIAKGFIIDKLADSLERQSPNFSGVVNAGGDLRFMGASHRKVTARLGPAEAPLLREILLSDRHPAFASSSSGVSLTDENSSTRYRLPLADGLTSAHTACVAAHECWVADALTKVALHAPWRVADRVAREYEASIVLFNARGELVASRGEV